MIKKKMATIEEMRAARDRFSKPKVINIPTKELVKNKLRPTMGVSEEELDAYAEQIANTDNPMKADIEASLDKINTNINSLSTQVPAQTENVITITMLGTTPMAGAAKTQLASVSSESQTMLNTYLETLTLAIDLGIELPDSFLLLGEAVNLLEGAASLLP